MANLPTEIIKIARPIHWVKNLALFAALIFTGELYHKAYLVNVIWAFIAFSLATSATYIFNDLIDIKADQAHPIKKNRPLASGRLPITVAIVELIALVVGSVYVAGSLNSIFFFTIIAYLVIQAFYSLILKNVAIVDILIIAFGFIIRVYAGAFVIDAHLSVWFLLCVVSAALFLASGKRRAELGIIDEHDKTRKSLSNYSKSLLSSYVTMFGSAAWLSWSLFTFFESPKTTLPVWLFLAEISRTTTINKLMMVTIPLVIYGIMRYQSLIFEDRGEAPEKLLLTDKSLIIAVVLFVISIIWIIYGGISVLS